MNQTEIIADLATALQAEVILVVGMRLGCINHALLTAAAINSAQIPFSGWIANCLHPHEARMDQMITYLIGQMPAPLLSTVVYGEKNILLKSDQIVNEKVLF